MTDKLVPLSTHIAPPSQSTAVPLLNGNFVDTSNSKDDIGVEEEPYTIKCICNFPGDDGNTIYCDTCDSWQHIECYYPDSVEDALREDFSHSCVDCEPRFVDRQRAIQNQRRRLHTNTTMANPEAAAAAAIASVEARGPLADNETVDKKTKRPASKSHKRKTKPPPSDLAAINGGHPPYHDHGKHTTQEHPNAPPTKKSKSHKASHSVSSQPHKRSPSFSAGRSHPHGQQPSPAATPHGSPLDCDIFPPAPGFFAAYSDHPMTLTNVNSFASLQVSSTMAAWPRDQAKMKKDTGFYPKDVFRKLPQRSTPQTLSVNHKTIPGPGDSMAFLRYLTTPAAIKKNEILVELNGAVDFQAPYCTRPENRWEQLTFPLPFVFFHDSLPLCIDTRTEGSAARYARRSCRPTARLETSLDTENTGVYHFMLVADRDIHAHEQITLPWDIRLPNDVKYRWLKLLGLVDEEPTKPIEASEADYMGVRDLTASLLSEYGGCSCDMGNECAFARFMRTWRAKFQPARPIAAPKKRTKSTKQSKAPVLSPIGTGHATNSRATSEGHHDDHEQDQASVSGSARSKPPSRDRTPAHPRQPSLDTFGVLPSEPTEREKRKAAAFEENRLRTENQKPKKKKPRVSDGSTPSTKSKSSKKMDTSSHAATSTSTPPRHQYADAATSRSKSLSPNDTITKKSKGSKLVQPADTKATQTRQVSRPTSTVLRPAYVDSSTQTEHVPWYLESKPASNMTSQRPLQPRRRLPSLAQRVLQNCHRFKADISAPCTPEKKNALASPSSDISKSPTSDHNEKPSAASPSSPSAASLAAPVSPSPPTSTSVSAHGSATKEKPGSPGKGQSPTSFVSVDMDMPDAPTILPDIVKSSLNIPLSRISTESSSASLNAQLGNLQVQMSMAPALNGPSLTASNPISISAATANSPSTSSASAMNGILHNPSPVRKKLSLSDYTKRHKAGSTLSTATPARPAMSPPNDIKKVVGQESNSIAATAASAVSEKYASEPTKTPAIPSTNGSL